MNTAVFYMQHVCLAPSSRPMTTTSLRFVLQVFGKALAQLLACTPPVLLVITSRIRVVFSGFVVHNVEMQHFADHDAVNLLSWLAPELSPAAARQLARHCGNIPIVLCIVGSAIGQLQVPYQVSY